MPKKVEMNLTVVDRKFFYGIIETVSQLRL